jgi:hypothetical protein
VALRDKIRTNAAPFLEPGETVQAVFNTQTGPSPYWSILTYLVLFWIRVHVVVVTDRRILLLQGSYWKPSASRSIEAVFPRATRLGPQSGLWGTLELNGKKHWVHKRWHKDIALADSQLGGAAPAAGALPAAAGYAPAGVAPQAPAPAAAQAPAPAAPQQAPPPSLPQPEPAASFPAGWYADPHGEARLRWWDGSTWTGHVSG